MTEEEDASWRPSIRLMKLRYKRMLTGMARKEKAISRRRLKRDWLVYILRCSDGRLYTGITNNMDRRLKMHNGGTGARYTRVRRPVELVYQENGLTRSQALTRECGIKAMSRAKKENLITKLNHQLKVVGRGSKGPIPSKNFKEKIP